MIPNLGGCGRALRGSAASMLVVVGLAGGCAAQNEEAPARDAKRSRAADEAQGGDVAAPTAAAEAEAVVEQEEVDTAEMGSPPSLEEYQRELAANNAKLRALGVELPVVNTQTATPKPTATPNGEAVGGAPSPSAPSAGSGSGVTKKSTGRDKPASTPKPAKSKDVGGTDNDAEAKPSADKPTETKRDAKPDAAKATPLGPNVDARNQDAVGRCEQICDLGEISCGLGDQICELAERHPGDEDYVSACERAINDCDAAKEACDVCAE